MPIKNISLLFLAFVDISVYRQKHLTSCLVFIQRIQTCIQVLQRVIRQVVTDGFMMIKKILCKVII